jgi:tetratricopeptide (TPR) repeat protein
MLERIGEIIAVKHARGASEHEIARDRFNRYAPLLRLGRPGEAQRELEHCLEVFENAEDAHNRAKALSALADVFDKRGDLPQAVALERRALAFRNTLPNPVDRAISHNNLGNYLERLGHLPEVAAHELTALTYRLVIGHGQDLQTSARNHTVRLLRARRSGREHTLPRVADLVARPDLAALRDWLTAGQVDLDELQQAVDGFVARCRAEAERTLNEERS